MYENKLVGETGAQPSPNNNNGILIYATIIVPLKYLNQFLGALEVPLTNCKVKLKLKWTRHCVLSAVDADNVDVNDDDIIFLLSET